MNLSARIPLGQTGVAVPLLGIGTGSFRGLYREVPDDEAIETIHAALDSGVTLVDTAPWYGAFEAERIVGAALATRPRASYVLSTKACLWNENGEGVHGFRRDQVLWSLEGSLRRLKVDQVDILHLHDPVRSDYATILDETLPTFLDLRAQGVIRAIGCGTGDWRLLDDLTRDFTFDCVMLAGRYTLLEQEALPLLNRLREQRVPVFSAGIYNSGVLATGAAPGGKYNYSDAPPEIRERVARLSRVCDVHGVPLKAAAAQFVRAHPAIATIIFGVESAAQVAENIAAFDTPIPLALWEHLRADAMIPPDAPTPETI